MITIDRMVGLGATEEQTLTPPVSLATLATRDRLAIASAILLVAGVALPNVSLRAIAITYEPDDLAYPLSVSPGDNITVIVNQTSYKRYMHASGGGPNQGVEYWKSVDGGVPHEFRDIAGTTLMNPATYNFTYETGGKIAFVYLLSSICGYQGTEPGLDLSCPPFEISAATAFDLLSWTTDVQVVRVGGDVDSYFFDKYLNPLGQATEMIYESGISGIVVVAPHGGTTNVTFTISPVSFPPSNLAVVLVPLLAVLAVSVVLVVLVRRRKKRKDDQS